MVDIIMKIKEIVANNKRPDLLYGSILKSLVLLSVPVMLSNFSHTLFNLVDAFWVGKLGKEAFSAPTISFPIIFFIISFGSGLSVAATALIAQYTGAGKKDKSEIIAGQVITVMLFFSLVISTLGIIFLNNILSFLKVPTSVWNYTHQYIFIILLGMPVYFIFIAYQGIRFGLGDTFTPMLIQFIVVGLNIILDPFLIFGIWIFPRLDVKGAAIATVFSRAVAAIVIIYWIVRDREINIKLKHLIPNFNYIGKILKIGLPASLGQSGTSLGFILMISFVNRFGASVISAFGIGNRIVILAMLPAMGIASAVATIVGQNLGADNIKRAVKIIWYAMAMVASILLIWSTFTFVLGQYVVKFFINNEEVIFYGKEFFKIVPYSTVFFGLAFIMNGAFQGSGHTVPVMIVTLSRLWVFRIPISYFLAFKLNYGAKGIWWGFFISNVLAGILAYVIFISGKWKHKIIN
ncbi:MAG: MATE family efflux transporter [Candidatus Cloacimonadota bacterium]|nr:MAG: MATE family efflux transporter [Candidatus Cloacimonadota bacterium]